MQDNNHVCKIAFRDPVELDIILYHMGLYGAYLDHEFTAWAMHKAIIGTPQVQAFAAVDLADAKRKSGE